MNKPNTNQCQIVQCECGHGEWCSTHDQHFEHCHPSTSSWEEDLPIYLWGKRMQLRTTANAKKTAKMLEPFIEKVASSAREEERKRIEKAIQPALDDFNGAGKVLIQKGLVKSGTEMIENVGYIKGLFLEAQEDKGE